MYTKRLEFLAGRYVSHKILQYYTYKSVSLPLKPKNGLRKTDIDDDD